MFEHRVDLEKPSDQWHIHLKDCGPHKPRRFCMAVLERNGRDIALFQPTPGQLAKIRAGRGSIRITVSQQFPV